MQVPSSYGPPEAWKGTTPTRGTFVFDFVSNAPPPDNSEPIGGTEARLLQRLPPLAAGNFRSPLIVALQPVLAADDQLLDFLHHSIGIQFGDWGQALPEPNFAEADLQVGG